MKSANNTESPIGDDGPASWVISSFGDGCGNKARNRMQSRIPSIPGTTTTLFESERRTDGTQEIRDISDGRKREEESESFFFPLSFDG